MSTAAPDARMRLPREPYPGLRPFLDFEAALLFGRERQVREVLEHLKQTQFVAVLGGSGSGKSSLIHAGVMPALRSYGIPGAGDLWLPMTCTPGTNVAGVAATARLHTPITRLARRFAALLDSRGSEAANAARQSEIAEVFRQPAGFARLIDQYGAELAVPPGPDRAEARVLFVLDQFEELFHPTNRDVDDVKLLVERVLDHFFSPHERCHVVITMRSEHLNDCASFLELPDAINKSSYLVRRLDADELREAITGPAQRFLRLMSRQRGGSERSLPAEVRFEPAVVERLLRDVQALAHDPDHLPLLQHLLARLWEAALEREDLDMPVPHQVTLADLQRAVAAGHAGTRAPLAEDVNTLRACVEHWPETLYQWHDEAARPQLDALFRQLAYKDPNTGLYSQQRIDVDRCESFMGAGCTRADLRALVAEGFLGGVDYLFWDDDDPSRVTLKVSHESFIRGWRRFRDLIDAESAHFEEFVGVLRKAAEWALESRAEDYLLETAELRRLADSGFLVRLREPNQREAWRRFLRLDRDGGRLGDHEPLLEGFVDDSLARQAQRRRRTLAARRSTQALIASTVLFALLPTALFAIFVQGPTMRRAEQLFEAGNRADRLLIPPQQPRVGGQADTLDSLLRAAELVETARLGVGSERLKVSHWLLSSVGELPPFRAQRDFLESVFVLNEPAPRVNEALMDQMSRAVWSGGPAAALPAGAVEVPAPEVERGALCFRPDDPDGAGELRGLRFMLPAPPNAAARSGRPRRAVFVPDIDRGSPKVEVYSALVDPANGLCLIGDSVVGYPVVLQPRIAIDRQLRNFYIALAGPGAAKPVVLVQQIDWERGVDGRIQAFGRDVRVALTDPHADGAVRAVTGDELAAVLPTWRVSAGVVVSLAGRQWRLVAREAVRVEPEQAPALVPLAAAGSACATLVSDDASGGGVRPQIHEADGHCLLVRESGGGLERRTVELAVHARPAGAKALRAAGREPTPLLGYVPFTRVPADDVASEDGGPRYAFGRGAHEGWVLMRLKSPEGRERWVGAPWSTCALWRLGRELQLANPPVGEAQAGESPVCLATSTPP
jgi:hypothetical protein